MMECLSRGIFDIGGGVVNTDTSQLSDSAIDGRFVSLKWFTIELQNNAGWEEAANHHPHNTTPAPTLATNYA